MKKFESLGRSLSKNEMKMVLGGVNTMACSCMDGDRTLDTVVCNYNSFGGAFNCGAGALKYCQSTYGTGNMSCVF